MSYKIIANEDQPQPFIECLPDLELYEAYPRCLALLRLEE